MDWLNQNRIKNWLIAILVVVNIVSLSLFWQHTMESDSPPPPQIKSKSGSESINLMSKVLDLTPEQTARLEKMQTVNVDELKKRNDQLYLLKTKIAEELFKDKPDTSLAGDYAKKIGELQAEVELLRFGHFNGLLSLCTPDQKEKLKPVLVEFFGRKPPKDPPKEEKGIKLEKKVQEPQGKKNAPPKDEVKQEEPRGNQPPPPGVEEKVEKYAKRLHLTPVQIEKLRAILSISNKKGDELRERNINDPDEREAERKKIKDEEDAAVMAILDPAQKEEFQKMLQKRRK